jgi:hypothetical protein
MLTDPSLIRLRALVECIQSIVKGFKCEAMNGVICTPPSDENGLEDWNAAPNRTWCQRCKARWKELFVVSDKLSALLTELEEEQKQNEQGEQGGPGCGI